METQNNELELMRQQMDILKSKLDNEQIVNERLMRESMKNKMSWIHKFVWAEIFIVPLLIIFFFGTASAFGLSYGPVILISVVLIASTTCDYKINKTGDKTFLSGNLVDEAAKLVRMKKLRIRYELYAIPAGLVWAIWFFLDIYNHKYHLTMRVERYAQEQVPKQDQQFILSGGQSSEGKKVTGIGGIMFKSKDPKATRKWYEEKLGIKDDPNGHLFEWIDKDDRSTVGVTVWSPMPSATEYLGKPEQQFMINYRVENLEQLAKELQNKGVTLLDTIQNYEGLGKFLHILDIDGRRVELWEPAR